MEVVPPMRDRGLELGLVIVGTHQWRLHSHHKLIAIAEVFGSVHPWIGSSSGNISKSDYLPLHCTLAGASTLAGLWLRCKCRFSLLDAVVIEFLPLLLLPLLHF